MLIMNKKFLSVTKNVNENGETEVLLQFDTALIRNGILSNLTPTQLKVLMTIGSYMDEEGNAFPTLRTISEVSGVSVNTVNKAVKELLDVRVEGLPLMNRELVGTGSKQYTIYHFTIDTENPVIEEKTIEERKTPKQNILYFCEAFEKQYLIKYTVNWQRETIFMKNVMKKYSDEEIRVIIDVAVTEYDKRWSKPAYKTPTLYSTFNFYAEQCLKINSERTAKKTVANKWDKYENTEEELIL
jgi:hypothetical protein